MLCADVNDCFLSVAFFEGFEAYRIHKEHDHDLLSRSYFKVKQKDFLSRVSETILGKDGQSQLGVAGRLWLPL
jgi:hypothetical protein